MLGLQVLGEGPLVFGVQYTQGDTEFSLVVILASVLTWLGLLTFQRRDFQNFKEMTNTFCCMTLKKTAVSSRKVVTQSQITVRESEM